MSGANSSELEAMDDLKAEEEVLETLLRGKVVAIVKRHRANKLLIQFDDGTRLYVDGSRDGLELSVTGGAEEQ